MMKILNLIVNGTYIKIKLIFQKVVCICQVTPHHQPPDRELPFLHRGERETRVTGDEEQGTMGRRKMRGEATSRPFSPSRLPLRANFPREKDHRETSGYEGALSPFRLKARDI